MEHSSTVPKKLNRIKPPPNSPPSIKQNKIKLLIKQQHFLPLSLRHEYNLYKKCKKKKKKKYTIPFLTGEKLKRENKTAEKFFFSKLKEQKQQYDDTAKFTIHISLSNKIKLNNEQRKLN